MFCLLAPVCPSATRAVAGHRADSRRSSSPPGPAWKTWPSVPWNFQDSGARFRCSAPCPRCLRPPALSLGLRRRVPLGMACAAGQVQGKQTEIPARRGGYTVTEPPRGALNLAPVGDQTVSASTGPPHEPAAVTFCRCAERWPARRGHWGGAFHDANDSGPPSLTSGGARKSARKDHSHAAPRARGQTRTGERAPPMPQSRIPPSPRCDFFPRDPKVNLRNRACKIKGF